MYYPPQSPVQNPNDHSGLAIAALVLGIVGAASWLLPICGLPINILAVIFGAIGIKSSKQGMAITGLVLGSIGVLLGILNAVLGFALLSEAWYY